MISRFLIASFVLLVSAGSPWPRDDEMSKISMGNHRARILVKSATEIAHLRFDVPTERIAKRAVGVAVFSENGSRVKNALSKTRDSKLSLAFEATHGGTFHCYFLPYVWSGEKTSLFFKVDYLNESSTISNGEKSWLEKADSVDFGESNAELIDFEARTAFDEFGPMETPASDSDVQSLLKNCAPKVALVFPEDRSHQTRMVDQIPARWGLERHQYGVSGGKCNSAAFVGEAKRDEFYVFQLVIWAAANQEIEIVSNSFSFTPPNYTVEAFPSLTLDTEALPRNMFRAINLGGTDLSGNAFTHDNIVVKAGHTQAIYVGGLVPKNLTVGRTYVGISTVTLTAQGHTDVFNIPVSIKILEGLAVEHGDEKVENLSRLRWLDSTIGITEKVTRPYTPINVKTKTKDGAPMYLIETLNKKFVVGGGGLISSLKLKGGGELLANSIDFLVKNSEGDSISWDENISTISSETESTLILNFERKFERDGINLRLKIELQINYDGYIDGNAWIYLDENPNTKREGEGEQEEREGEGEALFDCGDLVVEIPILKKHARFFSGLGEEGGLRDRDINWKWTQRAGTGSNQVWVGSHAAGIRLKPKENNFSANSPLHIISVDEDVAWVAGGISVREHENHVLLSANTGPLFVDAKGVKLYFDLSVTPVRPLEIREFFSKKIYQYGYNGLASPAEAAGLGANVYNIHQGTKENPYINFPFDPPTLPLLNLSLSAAHHHNFAAVNIYYTMRELSVRAADFFALRSMTADKIFTSGFVEGGPWLREHLISQNFSVAWTSLLEDGSLDPAIHTVSNNRYTNYYLEGVRSLLSQSPQLHGLYIDETSMSRATVRRLKIILDEIEIRDAHNIFDRHPKIDFHSCNKNHCPHNNLGEIIGCSSGVIYLTHFSFMHRLWFGEGFGYLSATKEQYLTEMSGIPFGLMADALNLPPLATYKGLAHGMSNRPSPMIWNILNEINAEACSFVGWWDPNRLAFTSNDDVVATVFYHSENQTALVVLASFLNFDTQVSVTIEWDLMPTLIRRRHVYVPLLPGLQFEQIDLDLTLPLTIQKGSGLIFMIH